MDEVWQDSAWLKCQDFDEELKAGESIFLLLFLYRGLLVWRTAYIQMFGKLSVKYFIFYPVWLMCVDHDSEVLQEKILFKRIFTTLKKLTLSSHGLERNLLAVRLAWVHSNTFGIAATMTHAWRSFPSKASHQCFSLDADRWSTLLCEL